VRGDVERVRIGARTNIQDHTTIHVVSGRWPTLIGRGVTVGHAVVLHGCTIADDCLIGIGARVLDGAVVEAGSLIGAGALLTPGTHVPPHSLVLGSPGRRVREVTADELTRIHALAARYVEYAARYRAEGVR
jgi:carbonic anhydrase/acetyltransferase-like protein (isoleucine patch superfamily)